MFHAFRHHRVVVERIAELNEMEYDHLRDIEPVSARARDKAMHFLSRRPDLTNGMSVAATPDGGIVMDFIRNGREYLVKIESKGNISIIAGTDGENRTPVSIMSRGIDRDFLQELAEEIPDPLSPEVQRGEGAYQSPVPGFISGGNLSKDKIFEITTDGGQLIGVKNKHTKYGFDLTCFSAPEGAAITVDTIDDVAREMASQGHKVLMARRFNGTRIVSLHDISVFPTSIIKKAKLPSGCRLSELQEVAARRALRS
ncbi:hypothetical protein ACGYLO_12175 [Sulfitobacter sp. 1A13353]|uniref:hypothetical protein n=1 Tax=Sulfitobacter sp. 1A13353 TaxID=3368568 RepID=UPI0037476348